jgi:hypothetical protein
MSGLIATGEDYQSKAMSGFIRESAEEQKIDEENKNLAAQQQQQTIGMVSSGVGAAASIGLMIAMCAE